MEEKEDNTNLFPGVMVTITKSDEQEGIKVGKTYIVSVIEGDEVYLQSARSTEQNYLHSDDEYRAATYPEISVFFTERFSRAFSGE